VWSLGVLMYQCLTGSTPFHSRNYNALMVDIMTRPHRPILEAAPSLDRALCAIVEGCLVKDRNQRIPSARDLAERLGAVARRLARDVSQVGRMPQRRATDRLPPVRGASAPKPAQRMADLFGSSRVRIASAAGLVGILVGAVSSYALTSGDANGRAGKPDTGSDSQSDSAGPKTAPLPAPGAARAAVARSKD
jgi:eukaryotic-like serine/threonine-protein kinase